MRDKRTPKDVCGEARGKCVSSDFLNEKVLLILTCTILKIKAQLK